MTLARRRYWIFDLDGTLTHAVHDFDALRRELGIEGGVPILEHLEALPQAERARLEGRLLAWEAAHVARAVAAPDAVVLLERLAARGVRCGVLTRNTRDLALRTLEATGIASFFDPLDVVGRTCALPKPAPDGVLRILARWGADPGEAVMVGDWVFDVQAGRAAGTATVLVDRDGCGRFRDECDIAVGRLDELIGEEP